ncbi:hypothetical protein SCHPADRAFT_938393 [Schizopora paradoxa]|uniref:Uncharacterized protein n=1 Tax=Schizopora paradoxa TaxID=27342 RepID=A0A0H2RVB4_9AGAM|nr:hypothetical protein SCHPADRAFT_938393 [Schizopora paradoxa]
MFYFKRSWLPKRERHGLQGQRIAGNRYHEVGLVNSSLASPPLAEDLATPSTMVSLHHLQRVTRREKFAPPDWETIEDSQLDSLSDYSGISNSSVGIPSASARRLEGRLADLMSEIQKAREDINRPINTEDDTSVAETPPGYVNEIGRAH